MDITWKYVIPLRNQDSIDIFENKYGISFPEDLKNIMKQYNGGCPSLYYFDTAKEKQNEFKTLLSFNEDDDETIYDFLNTDDLSYIPFASDPAGNLFCFQGNAIYFWQHELDEMEYLADSFTDFLRKLY